MEADAKAEGLRAALDASRLECSQAIARSEKELETAQRRADDAVADQCVRVAALRGMLMATDEERVRLECVSEQLEAQLRRGEQALLAIVQSSREVVETIASPPPNRGLHMQV